MVLEHKQSQDYIDELALAMKGVPPELPLMLSDHDKERYTWTDGLRRPLCWVSQVA